MDQSSSEQLHLRSDWRILGRCRAAQLRNVVDQRLREAPWGTLAVLALLGLIWTTLYFLLSGVFRHLQSWGLLRVVADQHIFIHFFLVLAIMLVFSNAILTFGCLYGRGEAGHLLSLPLRARQVVCVKWFESMLLSSWSFLLLGVPLMLAVASSTTVAWYYYPLFLGHFIGFIAIPACLGLLAACAVALWAPRRPVRIVVAGVGLCLVLALLWLANISQQAVESEEWLRRIVKQAGIAKQWWLPSTWTAKGVGSAIGRRVDESLFYLLVVLGNAAWLSWATVNILGRTWAEAFSRAQQGHLRTTVRHGWFTAALCWGLFFYLPKHLRMVMLKDLRGFARDAKQWTQMVIMLGLLVIYVLNLSRLPLDLDSAGTRALVAFLNLMTISLILATFTSRFVYPLLSLESQQLWLLELLPLRRGTLLWVKFLFALTVIGLSGCGVMLLAVRALDLPPAWAWLNVGICGGVCIGLAGLAIGLGARFPVIGQRNPARIASGFGGTLNLIVSMLFVMMQMAGVAALSLFEVSRGLVLPESLSVQTWQMVAMLLALSVLVAGVAMWLGGRHFERLEC